MKSLRFLSSAVFGALLLAACGGGAAPSAAPVSSGPASAGAAKPAASTAAPASAAAGASAKPATSGATSTAAKPAASAAAAAAAGGKPLVLSYSAIIGNNLPEWTADAAGIFKQNGLNVQLTYIESSKGIPALLAGETWAMNLGGSETLAAVAQGADLVTVTDNAPVYSFILQVAPEIKTAADLKGKKLGVSQFGSASDIALRVALKKLNLDPEKDVSILAVGSASTRLAAMESGAIQGGMSFPPESLNLEAKGFHTLVDLAALKAPSNIGTTSFTRAYLNANRPIVQKYVDSVVEGIARARKDKAFTIDVLKKYHKSDDQKAMEATYDFFVNEVIPQYPHPLPEQYADTVSILSAKDPKVKDVDLSKMLDDSFMKDAESRGVGKA